MMVGAARSGEKGAGGLLGRRLEWLCRPGVEALERTRCVLKGGFSWTWRQNAAHRLCRSPILFASRHFAHDEDRFAGETFSIPHRLPVP